MLNRLFRKNDPLTLVIVVLVLLMMRLPSFTPLVPMFLSELKWHLLGESLSNGAWMYEQIWDDTGPLSAFVYWMLDILFGKSVLAYRLLSMFMVLAQAALFNFVLNNRRIYNEKTFLPALMYAICMGLSIDYCTLPPVLLALFPLLLFINNIFKHGDTPVDDEFFWTGTYLALATLFYLPSIVFVIIVLLGAIIFKYASPRQYILVFYGLFFVLLSTCVYYYVTNRLYDVFEQYIWAAFVLEAYHWQSALSVWGILVIPGIFLSAAIFITAQNGNFINYQTNCQRIVLIWIAVALLSLFFIRDIAGYHTMLLVPGTAFFMVHLILSLKRALWADLSIWAFMVSIALGGYWNIVFPSTNQGTILLVDEKKMIGGSEEGLLVLGPSLSYYQGFKNVTPYINWALAKYKHFEHIDQVATMLAIGQTIQTSSPDLIIDEEGLMPVLINRLPELGNIYVQEGGTGKHYRRTSFNAISR